MSAKELEKWNKVAKEALKGLDLSKYAKIGRAYLKAKES